MATTVASLMGVLDLEDRATSKLKGVKGLLGEVGKLFGGLSFAGIFGAAIKEASDSETVVAQFNNVLKSTGGAAGVTAAQATKLASALQRTTRFSDEQVLSVETLLLRFKGMSKNILPGATTAVLDLATALGIDTASAAKMLGKALTGGTGAMNALARAGIKFTDQQERQYKALLRSGQTLKAQKYLLDQVTVATGGAAQAAGNTFAGALDQAKNAVSDVLEALGGALLPTLTSVLHGFVSLIDALGPAAPVIVGVVAALMGIPAVLGLILSPVGLVVAAVGLLVGAVALIAATWGKDIERVYNAVKPTLDKIGKLFSGFFTDLFGKEGKPPEKTIADQILAGLDNMKIEKPAGMGEGIWKGIQDSMVDAIKGGDNSLASQAFHDKIYGMFSDQPVEANGLSVAFHNLIAGLAKEMPKLLAELGDALAPLGDGIKKGIEFALRQAMAGLSTTILAGLLHAAAQAAVDLATGAAQILILAQMFTSSLAGALAQAGISVDGMMNGIITGIATWLAGNATRVAGAFVGLKDGITMAFADGVAWLWADGIKAFEDVFGALATAAANQLGSIAASLVGAVAKGLIAIADILYKISGAGIPGVSEAALAAATALYKAAGREQGGPVTGGTPYIVGERGPELFVPGQSGSIIPNGGMGGLNIGTVIVQGVQNPRQFYDAMQAEARRRNRPLAGAM